MSVWPMLHDLSTPQTSISEARFRATDAESLSCPGPELECGPVQRVDDTHLLLGLPQGTRRWYTCRQGGVELFHEGGRCGVRDTPQTRQHRLCASAEERPS